MLTLESLSITYETRPILHAIALEVRAGELLALIGPNGAGKTTLIRAAAGLLAPAGGRAALAGEAVHTWSPEARARRIAVVPQAAHLPAGFTVRETVLMGRTPYLGWLGREGETDHAIARRALERTCLTDLAERPVEHLSGGEQQRVLIARALAQAAPVLLLDEPTAHLDLKHQAGTLSLVRDLAHADGLAVLVALHDLNLAAQFADRIALLAGGELRALGAPTEVLTPANLTAAYDVPVYVIPHPIHGAPLVLPDGAFRPHEPVR
ncbi:MAG: heme ABC transporter ATP-binding protein [Anaerolineales bacterium]|nr:heme ABC transporter ATP-binding protein [Anaerolineales bacterium]